MVENRVTMKVLAITLVCLMLGSIFGALPSVTYAATFNIGDTVEVTNTLDAGLKVRDAPAGNVIGGEFDGSCGVILGGPN